MTRDPVHGDMELPSELYAIMDTKEVQRLRGIRQLGTAFFVYPGAVHTRFEHSLGTCWLSLRLLNSLGIELAAKERLAILVYALLHDVTHLPYGHTLEDERRIFERHDEPARIEEAYPSGELGRVLKRLGLLESVLEVGLNRTSWQHQIVSGAVGADLLDYLARDAFFCGLGQSYDARIFSLFGFDSEKRRLFLDAQRNGVVRYDALSEITNLLRLRYFLSERVYFHHTKTASGAMISRAVEEAVTAGLSRKKLSTLTDEGLWMLLESQYAKLPIVAYLMSSLRSRKLYKRVFLLTAKLPIERRHQFVDDYHHSSKRRGRAESDIALSCKIDPKHLIIYCPALKMQLKEESLQVKVDCAPPRALDLLPTDEVSLLKERHRMLWRFFVFLSPEKMNKAEAVAKACEAYFAEANHLPHYRSGQLFLGI